MNQILSYMFQQAHSMPEESFEAESLVQEWAAYFELDHTTKTVELALKYYDELLPGTLTIRGRERIMARLGENAGIMILAATQKDQKLINAGLTHKLKSVQTAALHNPEISDEDKLEHLAQLLKTDPALANQDWVRWIGTNQLERFEELLADCNVTRLSKKWDEAFSVHSKVRRIWLYKREGVRKAKTAKDTNIENLIKEKNYTEAGKLLQKAKLSTETVVELLVELQEKDHEGAQKLLEVYVSHPARTTGYVSRRRYQPLYAPHNSQKVFDAAYREGIIVGAEHIHRLQQFIESATIEETLKVIDEFPEKEKPSLCLNNHWEEIFYRYLAENQGKKNLGEIAKQLLDDSILNKIWDEYGSWSTPQERVENVERTLKLIETFEELGELGHILHGLGGVIADYFIEPELEFVWKSDGEPLKKYATQAPEASIHVFDRISVKQAVRACETSIQEPGWRMGITHVSSARLLTHPSYIEILQKLIDQWDVNAERKPREKREQLIFAVIEQLIISEKHEQLRELLTNEKLNTVMRKSVYRHNPSKETSDIISAFDKQQLKTIIEILAETGALRALLAENIGPAMLLLKAYWAYGLTQKETIELLRISKITMNDVSTQSSAKILFISFTQHAMRNTSETSWDTFALAGNNWQGSFYDLYQFVESTI